MIITEKIIPGQFGLLKQRTSTVLDISQDGVVIGELVAKAADHHVTFEIISDSKLSVLQCAVLVTSFEVYLQFSNFTDTVILEVGVNFGQNYSGVFTKLDYDFFGKKFQKKLNVATLKKLREIKNRLFGRMNELPKIGQGYLIDMDRYKSTHIQILAKEYNSIIWGNFPWAIHSDIAVDERKVIEAHVSGYHGLEIGAGSGRMTGFLCDRFQSLHVTDYSEQVVRGLRLTTSKFSNVKVFKDSILAPKLEKGFYDFVMFWENGIGNILKAQDRLRVVLNMMNLCCKRGKVILAFRSFGDISCGHLMPSRKYHRVMGVYRTFSTEEIVKLFKSFDCKIDLVYGDERPAGGRAVFLIAQKK